MVSPLLASRRDGERSSRYSSGGKSSGRGAGAISRSIRQIGFAGTALPASRNFAGVWRYRGWRNSLPVSRLAVQHSGSMLGNAGGAEGQQISAEGEAPVIPCERAERADLR